MFFPPTTTFQQKFGNLEGTTGIDSDFVERGFNNVGAWIMGCNMFGHVVAQHATHMVLKMDQARFL